MCFHKRVSRLTKKAEPRRNCDANRESGTASDNRRWLRRLVRPLVLTRHGLYEKRRISSGLVRSECGRESCIVRCEISTITTHSRLSTSGRNQTRSTGKNTSSANSNKSPFLGITGTDSNCPSSSAFRFINRSFIGIIILCGVKWPNVES